jgi:hypothetical protein
VRSREARNVFTRPAELSAHGANVQKGQIVLGPRDADETSLSISNVSPSTVKLRGDSELNRP